MEDSVGYIPPSRPPEGEGGGYVYTNFQQSLVEVGGAEGVNSIALACSRCIPWMAGEGSEEERKVLAEGLVLVCTHMVCRGDMSGTLTASALSFISCSSFSLS